MAELNHARLRLPPIGLGGSTLGGMREDCVPGDEMVQESYTTAWDAGIRFFDTAPLYGSGYGEKQLGKWLRTRRRNACYLSTKVGVYGQPGPRFDYSYEGTLRSVAASMERLGVDQLDAVFIHDIDPHSHGPGQWKIRFSEAMDGAYPALNRLKAERVIQGIGVGVNSCKVGQRSLAAADFDVLMLAGRLTPLDQSANGVVTRLCARKGVAIIAAAPFNSGILAAGSHSKARYKEAQAPLHIVRKVRKLEALCGEFRVPLGAVALQFPLRQPTVACVLPGPRNPSQVREICEWFKKQIPAALWSRLDCDPDFNDVTVAT